VADVLVFVLEQHREEIQVLAHLLTATRHTSAYVSIRQHTSAYVSILQHKSAYVGIRQHTSAYVSIRQHTSTYVSIRQHKSAHVSIPALHRPLASSSLAAYPVLHLVESALQVTEAHDAAGDLRAPPRSAYVSIRQHTSAYVCVDCR